MLWFWCWCNFAWVWSFPSQNVQHIANRTKIQGAQEGVSHFMEGSGILRWVYSKRMNSAGILTPVLDSPDIFGSLRWIRVFVVMGVAFIWALKLTRGWILRSTVVLVTWMKKHISRICARFMKPGSFSGLFWWFC